MKRIYATTLCGAVIAALAVAGSAQPATEIAPQTGSPQSTMNQPTSGPQEKGKLSREDEAFLKKAAGINLSEIEAGKLAERMSSDPKVKQLGSMLIKDHTEAHRKLERLAASKGVTLPTELSMWDRKSLSSLQNESGDKFNKDFLAFNLKGHEKAVSLFEKESARTQDPDIKAWAQKMVPALKEHLAMAKSGTPSMVGEKKPSMKHHKK